MGVGTWEHQGLAVEARCAREQSPVQVLLQPVHLVVVVVEACRCFAVARRDGTPGLGDERQRALAHGAQVTRDGLLACQQVQRQLVHHGLLCLQFVVAIEHGIRDRANSTVVASRMAVSTSTTMSSSRAASWSSRSWNCFRIIVMAPWCVPGVGGEPRRKTFLAETFVRALLDACESTTEGRRARDFLPWPHHNWSYIVTSSVEYLIIPVTRNWGTETMYLSKDRVRPFAWFPLATLMAVVLGLVVPRTAQAQPPGNDDFDAAVIIGDLPFSTAISTVEATAAPDDPTSCSNNGSVWFSFTPGRNMTISADTFGSNYDTVLSAYTGPRGALALVPNGCNDDSGSAQSMVVFDATGGTTYHFAVSRCCGVGGSGGGTLSFSVKESVPPANDDFTQAVNIASLPFSQPADTAGATLEPGEPSGGCGSISGSLWYSFTPADTGSLSVTTSVILGYPVLTVLTGSSLGNLTPVGCHSYTGPTTFRAVAGQTYYLQLGAFTGGSTLVELSIRVAPPVHAAFGFTPADPSVFDSTGFFDNSSDPGGAQIVGWQWHFGDGASGTGCCPSHRYTADGDYTASLTVTTADGRTASTSQVIQVRTHDVSIDQFTVPRTARAGQTKRITVVVENVRYDETVRVELYRGTPVGFLRFGELTQYVPARQDRDVVFPFNYTFTPEDAAIGKVPFKAVAIVGGVRDAFYADNEVISPPTTVSPST